MKLLTNILYNTVIFFTSICVVDRVVAYFLKTIANISGVFKLMSYETQPPSLINEIINRWCIVFIKITLYNLLIYMLELC